MTTYIRDRHEDGKFSPISLEIDGKIFTYPGDELFKNFARKIGERVKVVDISDFGEVITSYMTIISEPYKNEDGVWSIEVNFDNTVIEEKR